MYPVYIHTLTGYHWVASSCDEAQCYHAMPVVSARVSVYGSGVLLLLWEGFSLWNLDVSLGPARLAWRVSAIPLRSRAKAAMAERALK